MVENASSSAAESAGGPGVADNRDVDESGSVGSTVGGMGWAGGMAERSSELPRV